jgi:hypothetical protein
MRIQKLRLVCCLSALFGVLPAIQAQKVTVQYNKQTSFAQYKTYSWLPHDPASYPTLALDIIGAVDHQLQDKGLQKVDKGGDLLVNGYGSLTDSMNVSYDVDIYAAPGLDSPITWAAGTPRPGNSTGVFVEKGTLVIDLADRRAKQLEWRGIAKAKLDPDQAEKAFEIVEKAIVKMFKEYPQK